LRVEFGSQRNEYEGKEGKEGKEGNKGNEGNEGKVKGEMLGFGYASTVIPRKVGEVVTMGSIVEDWGTQSWYVNAQEAQMIMVTPEYRLFLSSVSPRFVAEPS